jgi:hypothetical protein
LPVRDLLSGIICVVPLLLVQHYVPELFNENPALRITWALISAEVIQSAFKDFGTMVRRFIDHIATLILIPIFFIITRLGRITEAALSKAVSMARK